MKKTLSLILAIIMIFSTMTVSSISASAEIKKDYLYWAQDDASKPWYSMSIARDRHTSCTFAKYGCWIMSYTKLLIMTGAKNQDNFGPVDMINWVINNNVVNNNGDLVAGHQYTISNANNLNYIGQISCYGYADANNKIIEQVNNGYNVLVRLSGHTVIVDNDLTKQNGYATVSNSWKSSNYNVPLTYFTNRYSVQFIDVFQGDTTSPVISNVKTSSVTSSGYTASCTVTDNIGVASVKFDTYRGNTLVDSGYGTQSGNNWSYKFSKATVSGSYYTKITARDSAGNISSKNTQSVSVKCKVATPSISTSNTTGGKYVSISTATSGATIYYKLDNGSYKKYTGKFKLTATKTVYAYAKKSNYTNSSTANKKISIGTVATPTISAKNYVGGKTISISTKTSGATVYYKTSSNADYKKYTGSFKITDTKTIYAYAKKTGSKNSSSTNKKIPVYTTPKPTGVKAVASSSSAIKVSWKQVSGASGYYIYQSTSKNGTYKKVATVTKGSTLSKSVDSLSSSKTYYFKVKAYTSGKKTSAYSSIVSAKTKAAPSFDSKLKGTWRYVSEYLGDGDDKYEFIFDGANYVTVKVYGMDDITSKKVKYTRSGNSVSFSAYGKSFTVTYYSDSSLLGFVMKGSGYTWSDMLIKCSTVKYSFAFSDDEEEPLKSASSYLRGAYWKSNYLANNGYRDNGQVFFIASIQDWGSGYWTYSLEYFNGDSDSYNDGYNELNIMNKNVYHANFYLKGKYYNVVLEKKDSSKMNAFFMKDGKIVRDTWTAYKY